MTDLWRCGWEIPVAPIALTLLVASAVSVDLRADDHLAEAAVVVGQPVLPSSASKPPDEDKREADRSREPADGQARDAGGEGGEVDIELRGILRATPEDPPRETAEALLKALRRQRPTTEPIAPASLEDGPAVTGQDLLLPQGTTIVDRRGRLAGLDEPAAGPVAWRIVFESAPAPGQGGSSGAVADDGAGLDTEPADARTAWPRRADAAEGRRAVSQLGSIALLPNELLEVMVRTHEAASYPVTFIVSGEAMAFGGANYLLVRHVRRANLPPGGGSTDATADSTVTTPDPGDGPTDAEARGTAEDVLALLKQQEPGDAMLTPRAADRMQGRASSNGLSSGAQTIAPIPEGTPLTRRAGRLVPHGTWWQFAFESDSPEQAEPPLIFLPSKGLEAMIDFYKQGVSGLVFIVSGEITAYRGENYLLPRIVVRRIDNGNLRP